MIQSDLFGMVKCPRQRLSDLQLGDKKATLNYLANMDPMGHVLSASQQKAPTAPAFWETPEDEPEDGGHRGLLAVPRRC